MHESNGSFDENGQISLYRGIWGKNHIAIDIISPLAVFFMDKLYVVRYYLTKDQILHAKLQHVSYSIANF